MASRIRLRNASSSGDSPARPKAVILVPSVSRIAMSMASREVPLMKPSTRMKTSF